MSDFSKIANGTVLYNIYADLCANYCYEQTNMYICSAMNTFLLNDIYEKSNNDIVVELGRKFRDYRIALRQTQKDVAEQAGVSVMTIVRFERGEGSAIRMDNFVALMRAIQKLEAISEAIPDVPTSLYDPQPAEVKRRVKKRRDEK